MMPLAFACGKEHPLRVLCLGAHSDDIEIGCGGTLIRLIDSFPDCIVLWIILSANTTRAAEARKSTELYLASIHYKEVLIENFRDGFFPYNGGKLKEYFEKLKLRMNPDIIFTHNRNDLHQDHRLVADLTWNTFRDHFIMEYEILKYDGDIGTPNVFIPLTPSICEKKIKWLQECFKSQADNIWFEEDCFKAMMRIRCIEANSSSRYVEAFYCRKAIFAFEGSLNASS